MHDQIVAIAFDAMLLAACAIAGLTRFEENEMEPHAATR
jgi:hypothetical protein